MIVTIGGKIIWLDDRERVVKHEMVHAVLGGDGEHRHPLWRSLCVPGTC